MSRIKKKKKNLQHKRVKARRGVKLLEYTTANYSHQTETKKQYTQKKKSARINIFKLIYKNYYYLRLVIWPV